MTVLFAKLFLRLLSFLPAGAPYWLARKMSGLWIRLSPTKWETTQRNLERCYPDMAEEDRLRLARDSFVHYVASVLEAGHNWYWPVEKIKSRCEVVRGADLIAQYHAQPKGMILLAPHFGSWEHLGIFLQQYEDIAILYKPPSNPDLDQALLERRRRGGAKLLPADSRGVRELFHHLQAGHGVGILPDQEPSRGQGRFAPFFGNAALTGVLAPRVVQKVDCIVVFGVCERLPGGQYRVHVLSADEAIFDPDIDVALAALNRGVEQCIAIDPAQYLWSYRRFKTQPEGKPPFYA